MNKFVKKLNSSNVQDNVTHENVLDDKVIHENVSNENIDISDEIINVKMLISLMNMLILQLRMKMKIP